MYMFFFFFQAEDGIRDGRVTGVQTCALPIWLVEVREDGGGGTRVNLPQPPQPPPSSTNLQSQQPPQAERDADRVGVAPQHEAVARSVHAQDFPHVAQVA